MFSCFLALQDSNAEPAAGAQRTVQGRVRGPEKDNPDGGRLPTTEGPQHHHDGGRTRPRALLRLLRARQALPERHHPKWRQQQSGQWYERLGSSKSADSHAGCSAHWAAASGPRGPVAGMLYFKAISCLQWPEQSHSDKQALTSR